MRHSCRTLLWDTLVGHSCRTLLRATLLWGTLLGHFCSTLLWVTRVGNSCGTLLRDTLVGHSCGTPLWVTLMGHSIWYTLVGHSSETDTLVGHSSRTLLWVTLVGSSCGALFWDTLDTINHPAHQRHAAFTPACFALPSGTAPRKHTSHQGRTNPNGAATSRTWCRHTICPHTIQALRTRLPPKSGVQSPKRAFRR